MFSNCTFHASQYRPRNWRLYTNNCTYNEEYWCSNPNKQGNKYSNVHIQQDRRQCNPITVVYSDICHCHTFMYFSEGVYSHIINTKPHNLCSNCALNVFFYYSFSASCQLPQRCLYSRLDYVPCIYRNRALQRAGPK